MAKWVLTQDQLKCWHRELNELCFDGILPECTFVVGVYRGPDKLGAYAALYYANYSGSGTIFIHPESCCTTRYVKECLVHEMIHQWQDLCRLRIDHRAVFKAWCKHINELTGLVA